MYKEYAESVDVKVYDLMDQAIKDFEDQFGVDCNPTGYEASLNETGGIYEREYLINHLVQAPNGLWIETGGWFSIDIRDDDPNIYCLLALKINGEIVGECEGFRGWYDLRFREWDLEWDNY